MVGKNGRVKLSDKCECDNFSDSDSDNSAQLNRGSSSCGALAVSQDPKVLLASPCNSTVKIFVNTSSRGQGADNGRSKSKAASATASTKTLKGNYSMKTICLRFGRKNKKNKGIDAKKSELKQDYANQTSRINVGDQQTSDIDVAQLLDKRACCCSKSGGCGGCNTNTIIFPRGGAFGDKNDNLQSFIKSEVRSSYKMLEEVLDEVGKQRRELREIKERLDVFLRLVKENLYMMNYKNLDKLNSQFENAFPPRKSSLQRKSNTTSINGKSQILESQIINEDPLVKDTDVPAQEVIVNQLIVKEAAPVVEAVPEERKKKRFFPFCK